MNINSKMFNIPDVGAVMAYTHYLVMKGQIAGNLCFDGHIATVEETHVEEQCRAMCDKIRQLLAVSKEKDIPDLLECFDIAYRIGNRRMPDSVFINRYKRNVLRAWKAGDMEIEESSIFGIVAHEVSYHPKGTDREYVTTYLSLKDKWVATLKKHDCFPDVTAYENYRRLALIMRDSLGKEFGCHADDMKRRWYYKNRVEDLSTLSSLLLRSYRRFVCSLSTAVIDFDEKMELDNRIIEELSTRPDLHPNDREAYRLASEFNKTAVEN